MPRSMGRLSRPRVASGDGILVQHHAGLLQEHAEQQGIAAGEVQQAAIVVGQLGSRVSRGPLGEAQPAARFLFSGWRNSARRSSALDAGLQFARLNGLAM